MQKISIMLPKSNIEINIGTVINLCIYQKIKILYLYITKNTFLLYILTLEMVEAWYIEASANSLILKEKNCTIRFSVQSVFTID